MRGRVKVADSGVFLLLDDGSSTQSSADRWQALATDWQRRLENGALPGVEPSTCAVLAMRTNPAWGEDMGPHFSVVSLPGKGTADFEGTPDPFELSADADGNQVRVLTQNLRSKGAALAETDYEVDLSEPRLSFLLGVESNDEITNGPVMVAAAHERIRPVLDLIRASLGLKPFPHEHSVHTTLCKLTGKDHDHRAFRERLARWPTEGRYPKKLESLAGVLDVPDQDAVRPRKQPRIQSDPSDSCCACSGHGSGPGASTESKER